VLLCAPVYTNLEVTGPSITSAVFIYHRFPLHPPTPTHSEIKGGELGWYYLSLYILLETFFRSSDKI